MHIPFRCIADSRTERWLDIGETRTGIHECTRQIPSGHQREHELARCPLVNVWSARTRDNDRRSSVLFEAILRSAPSSLEAWPHRCIHRDTSHQMSSQIESKSKLKEGRRSEKVEGRTHHQSHRDEIRHNHTHTHTCTSYGQPLSAAVMFILSRK